MPERLDQAGEIATVTISMYEASIGVFVPFLGNLSELLDRGSAHAEARKIDPSVLLKMRLYPNMYSLRQQVDEANRHAILAGALLARRDPPTLPGGETDIAGLKSRIQQGTRGAIILTFGGGVNEMQRDLISQFTLGFPRADR